MLRIIDDDDVKRYGSRLMMTLNADDKSFDIIFLHILFSYDKINIIPLLFIIDLYHLASSTSSLM